MTDYKVLCIWLSNCIGQSVRSADLLYNYFDGSIDKIYNASDDDYSKIKYLNDKVRNNLQNKDLKEANEIIAWCAMKNVNIVTIYDSIYPKRLFAADSHPFVLYCKGSLIPLDKRLCVAMVGTRKMSEYGGRNAYDMGFDLAKAGAVIVSGMADGIDGAAHRGCLDAGGYTIAVLGNGIDRAYPSIHFELMDEIASKGCVITEFRPFTKPERFNFPLRNRIISGICQATLVVEAPEVSGALNTAKHCLSQHRRLYAIPGKIGEHSNFGTNVLITDGARAVTSAQEIIDDYSERYQTISSSDIPIEKVKKTVAPNYLAGAKTRARTAETSVSTIAETSKTDEKQATTAFSTDGLSENEIKVLHCFDSGKPVSPSYASSETGLPVSDVLTALTMLEIYGRIQNLSGDTYILI